VLIGWAVSGVLSQGDIVEKLAAPDLYLYTISIFGRLEFLLCKHRARKAAEEGSCDRTPCLWKGVVGGGGGGET